MKQCYQLGCFFNMPRYNFCEGDCRPFPPDFCAPHPPQYPCNPPQNCGCGFLNVAIPIGLIYFAGGFLLGQNLNCDRRNFC